MSNALLDQAVAFVRRQTDASPGIGLILGSGLGDVARRVEGVSIPYGDIPGFLPSTAPTHQGHLLIGLLDAIPVIVMAGRLHMYEGYSAAEVAFPVQLMAALGVRTLVVTNAAGGLNPDYAAGDLVLIEDHFSLANLAGADPLRGPNTDTDGPRFTNLNGAYDRDLLRQAEIIGESSRTPLKRGVYSFVVGPSLETPAEVRALRALGGDLVGMSTVPEVIAARHRGLDVLAISAVANMAVDSVDAPDVTTAEAVFAAMEEISPRLSALLGQLLPALNHRITT